MVADEYKDITLLIEIIGLWGLFAIGIWSTPLDTNGKINFDIFTALLAGALAIAYFDYKGKIPIGAKKRAEIWFWFSVFMELLQAGVAFVLNIVLWEYVTIEGHEVVTYQDLASLMFGGIGVVVVIHAAYLINNREKYIAKHMSRYKVKKTEQQTKIS